MTMSTAPAGQILDDALLLARMRKRESNSMRTG